MENTRQLISVPVMESVTQEKLLAEGHEHLGYFGCMIGNFRLFSPKDAPRVNVPRTTELYAVFSKGDAEMLVRKDSTLLGTTMMDGKFAWILTMGKLLKDPAEAETLPRIEVTHIAPGSSFTVDGQPYTLVEVKDDGGYNWKNSEGRYVLAQHFYLDGLPTVEDLARMRRHLP